VLGRLPAAVEPPPAHAPPIPDLVAGQVKLPECWAGFRLPHSLRQRTRPLIPDPIVGQVKLLEGWAGSRLPQSLRQRTRLLISHLVCPKPKLLECWAGSRLSQSLRQRTRPPSPIRLSESSSFSSAGQAPGCRSASASARAPSSPIWFAGQAKLLECWAGSRLSQSLRQRTRPLIPDLVCPKPKLLECWAGSRLTQSLRQRTRPLIPELVA
jgi:hypothetical protein